MKTIDFSYFIERYNAGEMSDAELVWFRKELEGNDKLRKEVMLRRQTDAVIKNMDIISLRNKLSGIEQKRSKVIPVRKAKKHNYLKALSVAAILIMTIGLTLFPGRKLTNAEILSRYYNEYQPTSGQRSAELIKNDDFNQGMEFYESHDFRNAALSFSKVVESNPKNMYANFLNGMSNYEDSKYTEAKQSFGKVIDDKKNYYVDQAEYYLALCYLQTDEDDKAIELLRKISTEGGFYAKVAKKMIRAKK